MWTTIKMQDDLFLDNNSNEICYYFFLLKDFPPFYLIFEVRQGGIKLEVDKFVEVGEFYQELNDITGLNLPLEKIYRSKGFPAHLIKRKHFNCLKHIDDIPEIIKKPDYVGISPNESGDTIELIKVFNKNILVGIKLDKDENYFYISTIHDIQQSKLDRRLHSGRIKKFNIDGSD